ncbi:TRAP-T-associated universal stress protein TeaD [bacterium HR07]|uniref:UspA domain protein n=2 Tax=Candidatus Bipolaricaulota TaxID=67810 RepID=H5SNJ6_9BACT|nr:UspA domain protein [uncultured Acetothermia bacterium]BAL59060.1 UspA domain protein [Candidatus Acetothermum autotrophicum]GBC76051.1 TRAP-T-associated universal stress protein TeaD [bacterium HR07]
MFQKILVANDGSENALRALEIAVDLARRYGAELHQLSVEEHLPHYAASLGEVLEAEREELDYFDAVAERAREIASRAGVQLECHIIAGHEVETIVRFAAENQFDLLVIGHKGHSKIWPFHMGSTAARIAEHSRTNVLIVQ